MKHKSVVWKVSKDELFDIADKSGSLNAVLRHFGLTGSSFYTLKDRLIAEGYDLSIFDKKTKELKQKVTWQPVPLSEILVEHSIYTRASVKSRLIKGKIIKYECAICQNPGTWNGSKMSLVLDHINGINDDHRLTNLRFLCPNCNSQTPTFAGKNVNWKKYKCTCGEIICKSSKMCVLCSNKNQRKTERPEKDELEKLVWELPTVEIAKRYNVSDNTIAKWVKSYGLTKPGRGYWQQIKLS